MIKYLLAIFISFTICFSSFAQCPGGFCPLPPQQKQQNDRAAKYPEFVIVEAGIGKGSGTCFYYDEKNNESYVFSVAHVVSKGQRGNVVLYDGTRLPFICIDSSIHRNTVRIGSFISEDSKLSGFWCYIENLQLWQPEYAILKVQGKIPKQRLVRDPDEPVRVGDKAFVIGWIGGRKFEIRFGTIIRLESGIIIVDVPAIPGMSGGAILREHKSELTQEEHDELVGLISATDGRNTIGVPISYVIKNIEYAAWLPWRRYAEEYDRLQQDYNRLQDELNRLREQFNRFQGQQQERQGKLQQEQKEEKIAPPNQSQPPDFDEKNGEPGMIGGWVFWGFVVVVVWLAILTFSGRGFVFSSSIAGWITRLIPGKVDDVIVALLALGENALAAYLSSKVKMSKNKFKQLQETAKRVREVINERK